MKTFEQDLRDGPLYNAVINGNMDFWQRGTTLNLTTVAARIADRHRSGTLGPTSKSITVSRSTNLPSGLIFPAQYSMEIVNNTAVASYAAADAIFPYQALIEGTALHPVNGKDFTVGFYMFSTISGTFALAVRNNGATSNYVTTFAASAGWGYYSVVIPWNSSLNTLDTNYAIELIIGAVTGSSAQASTLNAWTAVNSYSHASVTNWAASVSNTLRFAQVQLRPGQWSSAEMQTSFVRTASTYAEELRLCQRYCVAHINSNGGNNGIGMGGIANTTTSAQPNIIFPVAMRTNPSVTQTGTNMNLVNVGTSVATTSIGAFGGPATSDVLSGVLNVSVAAGLTAGVFYRLEWGVGAAAGSRLIFDSDY